MMILQAFEPIDGPVRGVSDCFDALSDFQVEWEGSGGYRHGTVAIGTTGSSCIIDLGDPDLEQDPMEEDPPPTGWRRLPLRFGVPLAGPHWFAVDALAWVGEALGCLEGAGLCIDGDRSADDAADDEVADEGVDDDGPMPGPLDRVHALSVWEHLHDAQSQGLALPRMSRRASLALWRYRREFRQGAERFDHLVWPEAQVLLDGEVARSAALWADPKRPLAFPPVELLVVVRGDSAGVLPADEVSTIDAGPGLPLGGAHELSPSPALEDLFARASLLPVERFKALADGDWSD